MFPFELISATRGDADAKTPVFSRKSYAVCTVEYIESGRGSLEINGELFEPGPDSVYILSKRSTHRYWPLRSDPWKKLFIVIDGALMEYLFRVYNMETVYYVPDCPQVKNIFRQFLALHADTAEGNRRGALLFHELVSELALVHYGNGGNADSPAEKLKEVLDTCEKTCFQLSEYVKKTSWSEAHLIRVFRHEYGVTPYQYLLTRKLDAAKQLLLYSNLSIKEIAEHLAFSDQYYFSNYFKQKFGVSPKFFKRRLKK